MTKQEHLEKSVENMNRFNGRYNGSLYNEWVLLLLTSIADSLATIADSLLEHDGE